MRQNLSSIPSFSSILQSYRLYFGNVKLFNSQKSYLYCRQSFSINFKCSSNIWLVRIDISIKAKILMVSNLLVSFRLLRTSPMAKSLRFGMDLFSQYQVVRIWPMIQSIYGLCSLSYSIPSIVSYRPISTMSNCTSSS